MDEAARALETRARAARLENDDALLERLGGEMIALGESSGDTEAIAWGNYHLGVALTHLNRGSEAERANLAALDLFTALGDRFAAARVMMNLAMTELDINLNAVKARRLYEEAIEIIRETGEPIRLAIALGNLAEIMRLEADYRGAIRTARESLGHFLEAADLGGAATQWITVAHCQALLRDYTLSAESMRAAFECLRQDPDARWMALYFDTWVVIAARLGHVESAAQLLGFADLYRFDKSVRRLQGMLPWLSSAKERIARELSDDRLHELTLAGEAMTLEQAQALAETIDV